MNKRWNVDGYFKISSLSEGVFLTVYPPLGDGTSVNIQEILLEVKEKRIRNVDYDAINSVVQSNDSSTVKIGENPETADTSQLFIIDVSKDEFSAYLTILIPPESGHVITVKEVKNNLKQHNVVYGIMDEVIVEALKHEDYNKAILVAQGIKPVQGNDAIINYIFKEKKPPQFDDKQGRIDYKEYSPIISVSEGDVLATKTPATKGIIGMTVTGKKLMVKDGKDIPFPKGANIVVSEDGLELRAAKSGQLPISKSGEINIESVYLVKGDVDYTTGNIDFPGSVIINGNVLAGFTVVAEGNIEIKGAVEKAKVIAGGNIRVGSGVLGKREGLLKAGGDIIAKFVEYSVIESQGDVIISESILHSYVDARKRVVLNGRMGTILGGRIRAGQEIIAKTIGSWTEILTSLEVGIEPRIREEVADLIKEIDEDKKQFNEIRLGIKTLQMLKEKLKKLSTDKEELLNNHLDAQNFLMARLRDATERLSAINKEISVMNDGRIAVYSVVYPGVKISIKTATLTTRQEYKFVVFTAKGGVIEVHPYEEKKAKGNR